jgi:cytochrome c556
MRVNKLHVWGAVAAAAVMVTVAVAGMTATEAIKNRQGEMDGVRDAMKVLGEMAKKETAFDAAVVHKSAEEIALHLTEATELFPEGSDKGDVETWAKPEIWSDRDNFDRIMNDARESAVALQSVDDEDAFMPALGKLGNDCKTCHEQYRLPKH